MLRLLALSMLVASAPALAPSAFMRPRTARRSGVMMSASSDTSSSPTSTRRAFAFDSTGLGLGLALGSALPLPAMAASEKVPDEAELEKLRLGYARVQYLLKNWDYVTGKCTEKNAAKSDGSGGGCNVTPDRVSEFLGYRSMTDPLFKADKLMFRALPLVDEQNLDEYEEAIELFRQKADDAAGLAFTSSWGEANPGGGKDRVAAYLEKTQFYVVDVEKSLKLVLKYLDLKELPPLTGNL
uniref:Uncharacterized protein n=1 Tax=Florenciella parvula TaxID=236787 RepID=A0A7S2CLI3_9STRA|mmetsp:Transcript_30397/g.62071  ORF Transcript_30397/g.62071 Transcript_30397/m.62071 type:complete len:240 (+) Transcript_30397:118-837(+)|eukprot:CAMPEP_0182523210 /NCGR_PEP_ID=MMETSP1323-20130603/877_1 /TAXON_ID=236787 /ORGANISM="Florenciella parvula, Strain RCC1693" /LENGTH=239 /DNA_ID=CAMNT_0024731519 /DNA_START=118 /DNA_END=837 /DNA_ORIENTATION=-